MQTQNNSSNPQGYQAAPGVSAGVADPWDAFPEQFRPVLAAYHPVLVTEHDRMIASLLSAAPNRIRLPPITTIPTSRHELSPTFRRLCIELMAYTSDSRKAIIGIAQPVRFTLDHIFLALTIFRQPPDIDGAVYNLAEIVKKMVESFRTWAASWGADIPLGPCEYPDLAAVNLKEQAKKVLAQGCPPDDDNMWLHALLRALGDIPELWGFQGLPEARVPDSPFLATPIANSGAAGAPQPRPSGPELKFIHYRGPSSRKSDAPVPADATFVPQPLPTDHPSAATEPQRSPASSTTTIPQSSGDKSARFRYYRDTNGSRHSLPATSISLRGGRVRTSIPSMQQKVSRLAEILQIERERITLMEHERDIAQGLAEFFYRGLFTEYSHSFMASQLCQPYRAAILRSPNAMISMVVRICEHMERDLAILCELDKA